MRTAPVINHLIAQKRVRDRNYDLKTIRVEVAITDGSRLTGHAYFDAGLEAVVLTEDNDVHPHHIAMEHVVWLKEVKDA